MPRLLTAALTLVTTAVASAHFPFLVPDGPAKGKAVFSDNLKPDKDVPVDRIANTKLVVMYRRLVNELNLYRRATLAQAGSLPVSSRQRGRTSRSRTIPSPPRCGPPRSMRKTSDSSTRSI